MENCIKYQERISAFIDGLLTEAERLELMEHMANCPACQAYFDDQSAIHDALTGLEADAPAGLTEAVMARVRETKQDVPEKTVITFPHWRRWAATAACCAIAVLGVVSLGGRSSEAGLNASQNIVTYDLNRSQSESAVSDDVVAADSKTAAYTTQSGANTVQTDSAAACTLEDTDAPAAAPTAPEATRTDGTEAKNTAAVSYTLTTASSLAAEWIQEHLGQEWQSGCGYELTAEQFREVLDLLDTAGEVYTTKTVEDAPIGYLLLAE